MVGEKKFPYTAKGKKEAKQYAKKTASKKQPTMSYQTYTKTGKPAGMKTVAVKKTGAKRGY